jgi:SAM-dependent methyltransferase
MVLGILDCHVGSTLPMAADGVFDLETDERLATALDGLAATESFADLNRRAGEADAAAERRAGGSPEVQEKYSEHYARIAREVGLRHGDAILTKLNAIREEEGDGPIDGTWALEAGGGPGFFLPSFGRRFAAVVFVDCSLANLVQARKLVREEGLTNVFFIRGSVESLPLRSGSMDFVHQNGVIEHVADPVAMVRESIRVLSERGTYFCLSPNRYPISPEPHFRIPLFGIFPPPIRRLLVARVRGLTSEAGTDLRSLRQLKRIFRAANAGEPRVLFLPRLLRTTARSTPVRNLVRGMLQTPGLSRLLSAAVNGPLLPIMPYHIAIIRGGRNLPT